MLEELSEEQKNDKDLLTGCVAGALLKEDYLDKIKEAGFSVNILKENKKISKEQYGGIALESLMIEAVKYPPVILAKEDKVREKAQKIVSYFQLLPKVKEELEKRKDELGFKL